MKLPHNLLLEILKNLPIYDFCNFSLVCKAWNKAFNVTSHPEYRTPEFFLITAKRAHPFLTNITTFQDEYTWIYKLSLQEEAPRELLCLYVYRFFFFAFTCSSEPYNS